MYYAIGFVSLVVAVGSWLWWKEQQFMERQQKADAEAFVCDPKGWM